MALTRLTLTVVAIAFVGFGNAALAEQKGGETKWAPPNVPGAPGYKEPPKVTDDAAKGTTTQRQQPAGSYHQRRAVEQGSGNR